MTDCRINYQQVNDFSYNWSLLVLFITRRGINVRELERKLGLPPQRLSRLVSGKTKEPSLSTGMAVLGVAAQLLTSEQIESCRQTP